MPVNNPYELIQQLMDQNEGLLKTAADLNQTITGLNQTIAELKGQINKNSQNSSKPPSSDGLKKPSANKDRSLRSKSGKKQGAQEGHKGVHLTVVSDPDLIENHMHTGCSKCPMRDACLDMACVKETRYEIDAKVTVNATAHNLISIDNCPLHGA